MLPAVSYKKAQGPKPMDTSEVSSFLFIHLFLGKRKKLFDLKLWKWAIMVLVLIYGRLVSGD